MIETTGQLIGLSEFIDSLQDDNELLFILKNEVQETNNACLNELAPIGMHKNGSIKYKNRYGQEFEIFGKQGTEDRRITRTMNDDEELQRYLDARGKWIEILINKSVEL